MKNLIHPFKTVFLMALVCFSSVVIGAQPVKNSNLAPGSVHTIGHSSGLHTSSVLLYNQYNTYTVGIASQDFEAGYDMVDCKGADDFVVPAGKKWSIDEISIGATYGGTFPSPTVNFNVQFLEDNGGSPGALIEEFLNVSVNSTNFLSNGIIPLPSPVLLDEGTKWISVQFRYDFTGYGQSFWSGSSVQVTNDAMWINPAGGFGMGTGWISSQVISSNILDLQFALYGIESNTVPFPLLGSVIGFLVIGIASFFGLRRKK